MTTSIVFRFLAAAALPTGFTVALLLLGQAPVSAGSAGVASPQAQAVVQQYMAAPSVFIENAGQWADTSIRFALDGTGANVGLTDRGPRFQLFRKLGTVPSAASLRAETGLSPISPEGKRDGDVASTEMHEFGVVFPGALPVVPAGRGHSERTFNFLQGDVARHREGVPAFDAVWYEALYPGIALELTGRRTGIKYNFHIAPGADWRAIRVHYDGIQGLSLRPDGALEIRIAEGWEALLDGAPYIYQEVNGEKKTVSGKFRLLDDHSYGFEVTGEFDSALPLVIDPEIVWGDSSPDLIQESGRADLVLAANKED